MKKFYLVFLALLTFSITVYADNTAYTSPHLANVQLQVIQGVNAFPIDNHQWKVRVGVDPKSIGKGHKTTSGAMQNIVVVACAFGACQFASSNTGLGFYEVIFKLPVNIKDTDKTPVQVIACSRLGCAKSTFLTLIKEI